MNALWALATLAFAGCAATSTRSPEELVPIESAVATLSSELVEAARLRTDLSAMRVCVYEMRPEAISETVPGSLRRLSAIGEALEREFVVSLSNRINMLELPSADQRALTELADLHDVSHGLVGSFTEREEELVVTVKLVDSRSQLIVAVARGVVPSTGFDVVGQTIEPDYQLASVESTGLAADPVDATNEVATPMLEEDAVVRVDETDAPETSELASPASPSPVGVEPESTALATATPTQPAGESPLTKAPGKTPVAPGMARKPIGLPTPQNPNQVPDSAFTIEDLARSKGPAGRRLTVKKN